MRASPTFTHEETAAGANGDGFGFVWTTARLIPGKDNRHGYAHPHVAQFKPH